jgi:hypothetical protein
MSGLGREVRQMMRALWRRPAFAGTVVLTLGLGIGISTPVFSAVNGVLLRPLPSRGADRLVACAATRFLSAWLVGVSPTDPAVFEGVILVLLLVRALPCAVPARRVAQVDPLVALRDR